MPRLLEDRRAIVTGAARGIGSATATAMAQQGARVALVDLSTSGLATVARHIEGLGAETLPLLADVRVLAECELVVERVLAAWGGIDALVNCAGVLVEGSVPATDETEWDRVFAANAKATFLCCKSVIPHMARQGTGVIVNLSSAAALMSAQGLAAYSASKAAVVALTRCMAADHSRDGLRINCICPGGVDTDMLREAAVNFDSSGALMDLANKHAVGRLARPEEVAELVVYMVSNYCSFMTGSVVVFDGGLSLHV